MVIWSKPAKTDLRHIFEYIARDSPHYAKKITQEIVDKTDVLEDLPRIGHEVSEVSNDLIREISHYSYRILYEIQEPNVFILAVIHKRRELQPEMVGQ